MRVTVPLVVPVSTKSPTANGRVISSVTPAKTLESVFCSESESASPATLTSATSEVVETLSCPNITSAAVTQSTARTTLTSTRLSCASSVVLSSALRSRRTHSRMSTRQTKNMTSAASRLPSEMPPMSMFSSSRMPTEISPAAPASRPLRLNTSGT